MKRRVVIMLPQGDRVWVVEALVGGVRPSLGRATVVAVGAMAGTELSEAASAGQRVAEAMREARIAPGPAWVAVPRGEVALKKLTLPRTAGPRAAEDLIGMVRLQMGRLPAVSGASSTDFVHLPGSTISTGTSVASASAGAAGSVGGETCAVLAASMASARVAWLEAMVRAAGCTPRGVTLRLLGIAALAASGSEPARSEVQLLVAGVAGSYELVATQGGAPVFAREIETEVQGAGGEAAGVAVEVARSLVAIRTGEALEPARMSVLGSGPEAEALSTLLGGATELPCGPVDWTARVSAAGVGESERLALAPAAGLALLLGESSGLINLSHPKRPPPRGRRRQRAALLAVLGAIVLAGPLVVLGHRDLSERRETLRSLREQEETLRRRQDALVLAEARARHLREWSASGFDWLAHLRWIGEQIPVEQGTVLESVTASVRRSDLVFRPGSGTGLAAYLAGSWQHQRQAEVQLRGSTQRRDVANDLRRRILASDLYELESSGRDVPDRFAFDLRTSRRSPEPDGSGGGASSPGGAGAKEAGR